MTIRLSFIAAVALIAAAAGDLCVEITADTGVFGGGYADTNHMGVAPAIVAAAMFTSGLLILRAVDSWRQRGRGNSTTRLLSAWLDIGGSPRSQIALIVPLQLLVVYGMECAEALMVRRDFPGGVSWLGAPPVFSLVVQMLAAAICWWFMRGVIRWRLAGLLAVIHVPQSSSCC